MVRIFSAVVGPIPGTNWSWPDVAVLMLMGRSGGFFVVAETTVTTTSKKRAEDTKSCRHRSGFIDDSFQTCIAQVTLQTRITCRGQRMSVICTVLYLLS